MSYTRRHIDASYDFGSVRHAEPAGSSVYGLIHSGVSGSVPGQMAEFSLDEIGPDEYVGSLLKGLLIRGGKSIAGTVKYGHRIGITVRDPEGEIELLVPEHASRRELVLLRNRYILEARRLGMRPKSIRTVKRIMNLFIRSTGRLFGESDEWPETSSRWTQDELDDYDFNHEIDVETERIERRRKLAFAIKASLAVLGVAALGGSIYYALKHGEKSGTDLALPPQKPGVKIDPKKEVTAIDGLADHLHAGIKHSDVRQEGLFGIVAELSVAALRSLGNAFRRGVSAVEIRKLASSVHSRIQRMLLNPKINIPGILKYMPH